MSIWHDGSDGEWLDGGEQMWTEIHFRSCETRSGRPAIRFPVVLSDGSMGAVFVDCDLETVQRWGRGDEAARQLIRDQLLGTDGD